MKKVFMYICILFVFSFINVSSMNAECSYQERKDLLNAAKKVDVSFEIKSEKKIENVFDAFTQEEKQIEVETNYFNLNIVNLSENLFLRYYNDFDDSEEYVTFSNMENGLYSVRIDNISNIYTYYFEFMSNNNNCSGDIILTKNLIKPKYNYFSEFTICNEEKLKNTEYCKRFITEELGISEKVFLEKANSILESSDEDNVKEEFNILNFFKTYWYIFVIILVISIIIFISLIITKKRGKLV